MKENISLFIAIAGFVLSIYNAVRQIYFNRAKLRVTYRSHYCSETTTFNLVIENCSQLDISISKMSLIIGDKEYDFLYMPKNIWTIETKCGSEIKSRKEIDSISFPQTIGGLGSLGGYFAIKLDNETNKILMEPCKITIVISSNRGKLLFPLQTNKPQADDIY